MRRGSPYNSFNPLPHAEGDQEEAYCFRCCFNVSIHSLTQRETRACYAVLIAPADVSIHSLTQRETFLFYELFQTIQCFNPLPHAEGDVRFPSGALLGKCFNPLPHAEGDADKKLSCRTRRVSIHSLTQRETSVAAFTCKQAGVSIHSLTQRETVLQQGTPQSATFQSTPSRRGRRHTCCTGGKHSLVSIHSLTQRETHWFAYKTELEEVSIHSLTQRETSYVSIFSRFIPVSIHSLTQRETQKNQRCCNRRRVSIHSLTQRETETPGGKGDKEEFQSTPSRRGRPRFEAPAPP